MSKIQKIREFIAGCPFMDKFTNDVHIDWTSENIGDYGLIPTGESVIETQRDVLENKVIYKRYDVSLCAMHFTVNDIIRIESNGFLEEFIQWIEQQSNTGSAPTFGDNPADEYMTAANGMLYQLSSDGTTGRYEIKIQCFYEKNYNKEG